MGLTKQSDSNSIIIQAKHYSLWRGLKAAEPGCDSVEVNNPSTGERVVKYGYRYNNLTAFAVRLEWYDTGTKHDTQYLGFKMHMIDGDGSKFILDMPLNSPLLKKFMRVAPNLNFSKEISITVFRGKGEGAVDPTAIWFKQDDTTIFQAYTKDNPNGLPPAKQSRSTGKWNFDDQNDWLIERINEDTIPAVAAASVQRGDVLSSPRHIDAAPSHPASVTPQYIEDDDVPF